MKKMLIIVVLILLLTVGLTACGMSGGGENNSIEATGISLNTTSLTLTIGETSNLTASVEPTDASQSVTWSSSNTTAVTVTSSGQVKAIGVGNATITAKTSNSLTAICDVTVKDIDSSLIHTVAKPSESSMDIPQPTQLIDQTWNYTLTASGETQTFAYTARTANNTPLTTGRFLLTSTYSVNWRITDSSGNAILSGYSGSINGSSGSSHNMDLTIGVTYTITIQKATASGACEINVYAPNGISDITGRTEINDTLWYGSQISTYTYTPAISGEYLLQSSYSVNWRITDSFGNVKLSGYSGSINGSSGFSHNITLDEGETYTIQMQRASTSGQNILRIYQPNPKNLNITGKQKVYDSMRFSGQVNSYLFTPSTSGTYTLTTSYSVVWRITDSFGNAKLSGYSGSINGKSGSSHIITLNAGEQYTLFLEKSSGGSGDYVFEIKKQ